MNFSTNQELVHIAEAAAMPVSIRLAPAIRIIYPRYIYLLINLVDIISIIHIYKGQSCYIWKWLVVIYKHL